MSQGQQARLAAAVILIRPAESNGFEVLLTRHPDETFLDETYCFPGGALRKEDCSAAMLQRSFGLAADTARSIVGAHFNPQQALGFWAAGIRAVFEEVGILLAVREAERLLPTKLDRFEEHAGLFARGFSFQYWLESQGLLWDASRLVYFSHWQTPAETSPRIDTRFFLALSPQDQTPLPAWSEVAHSVWLTPDRALELFGKDQLPMMFPTFTSLRTLADFDSLESLSREYRVIRRRAKEKHLYQRRAQPRLA
jgi:8-oxo-dGTP pyrophosphatase MutT (NUDIX family)